MSYDYLNLKAGAPQRLRRLRRDFEQWFVKHPHAPRDRVTSWRDVRFATFKSDLGLDQGFNSTHNGPLAPKRPIWYTQSGPFFKRQEFVDEVEGSGINHRGWYSDADYNNTYRGVVVKLPHERFLAGYYMSDNGEYVYFDTIYTDISDAISEADGEARRLAEEEREHNEKWQEARRIESDCDDLIYRIQELFALRNHKHMGQDSREELAEKIEEVREKREKLATDYKDVEV